MFMPFLNSIRRRSTVCLLAIAALCTPLLATAQATYPSKPIRLLVPFSVGGGTDALGRVIAKGMSDRLGVAVIVENPAGASTIIGADRVAKSAPDGYTLLLTTTTTFATNPHTIGKMPFTIEDFAGVSLAASNPLVLAAPYDAPYDNVKELIRFAKENPKAPLQYGTQGRGATAHFVGAMIANEIGVNMTDVPYKGSAPGLMDLSSSQIPLLVDGTVASLPLVKSKKIKLLGVTSEKRLVAAPDTPTFVESGYPRLIADFKTAVFAPAGTPPDVIKTLNTTLKSVLSDKEIIDRFAASGTVILSSEPAETVRVYKEQHDNYGKLIKRLNLTFN